MLQELGNLHKDYTTLLLLEVVEREMLVILVVLVILALAALLEMLDQVAQAAAAVEEVATLGPTPAVGPEILELDQFPSGAMVAALALLEMLVVLELHLQVGRVDLVLLALLDLLEPLDQLALQLLHLE
jgi:hypothetical protein